MEEEKQGLWNKDSIKRNNESPMGSLIGGKSTGSGNEKNNMVQSTIIEREKKQLEKMMAKQVK